MHFGTQLKAEYVVKMGIFVSSAGLKAQDGETSHHRTIRLVSTTFTHPDNWWGNHLHKAHPVGVYTHVNHCLITDLLMEPNMFICWNQAVAVVCVSVVSCELVTETETYWKVPKTWGVPELQWLWFTVCVTLPYFCCCLLISRSQKCWTHISPATGRLKFSFCGSSLFYQ